MPHSVMKCVTGSKARWVVMIAATWGLAGPQAACSGGGNRRDDGGAGEAGASASDRDDESSGEGNDASGGNEGATRGGSGGRRNQEGDSGEETTGDTDGSGGVTSEELTIPAGCLVALDLSVATDFYEATRCIYEGDDAVQTGVASEDIDALRVAVVRGRVVDGAGGPLAGVKVSVLNHPEFGETLTRVDGFYDLAVHGGGHVTLRFEAPGWLRVQRRKNVQRRRFVPFPDIVMTEANAPLQAVTPVDLFEPVIVSGPSQTDNSGARRQRVLIAPETIPIAIMADGTEQILDDLSLRITEFTVGERGPNAMPGELPPTSGYTYAVDISVAEAEALGAVSVAFDPPIPTYVDNFLEFPAGTAVPTGYYDHKRDMWEASESGLVIDLLAEEDGLATIDIDGDGNAESTEDLEDLGIDEAERRALAATYAPGASLWRTPLPHLSIWDHNWPFSPPGDAAAPVGQVGQSGPDDCKRQVSGSIIGCEDQSLGEQIAIAGTPHRLRYQSERMPGRKDRNTFTLSIDGASVPPSAKAFLVEVDVLGQVHAERFTLPPPATWSFDWDGQDPYGRTWQGRQEARVRFGYAYDGVYENTDRFGIAGNGVAITGDRARAEVVLWSDWSGQMGGFNLDATGLGGFSLDVHHVLDARGGVLYQGDGVQRSAELIGGVIDRVAGTGRSDFSGDGGLALDAELDSPHGIAVRPDGAVLIADESNHRIRIIYPDGTVDTFAGSGQRSPLGDGGPALAAAIDSPLGLAFGPDGSLYVGERGTDRIRRIDPSGMISTFAGGGAPADDVGDGGLATDARFEEPHSLAWGADGTLYVADNEAHRIRAITVDGRIHTVAGTGVAGSLGDGGLAVDAELDAPLGIVAAPDGSIFVTEFDGDRVRKIRPDGRIETIAGTGQSGFSGDGGSATLARLNAPHSIALGHDGSLYITDEGNRRIRRIRPDGTIITVAGDGGSSSDGDGGSPLSAGFSRPRIVFYHLDDTLWILDYTDSVVRRVRPAFPSLLIGETIVGSKDGAEAFIFDADGRHLRTQSALHGNSIWSFAYTNAGMLSSITDAWGKVTSIERDAGGAPRAILGPYGANTQLEVDEFGFLSKLENQLGEMVELEFSDDGLLTEFTEPSGNRHKFSYDGMGRLVSDQRPSGLLQTLSRETAPSGTVVTLSSNGARSEHHETQLGAAATERTRRFTDAAGITTTLITAASSSSLQTPTFKRSSTYGGDPRFGTMASYQTTERIDWQSGTRTDIERSRLAILTGADPLSLTSLQESVAINGARYLNSYDRATRTLTQTSPAGRTQTLTFDEQGLPILVQTGAFDPVEITYDDDGRPIAAGFFGDETLYSYGSDGLLAQVENVLGETTTFRRDVTGRTTSQSNADGTDYSFAFDKNGGLVLVGVDSAVDHSFSYQSGGLLTSYTPPPLAGVSGDLWTAEYDAFEAVVARGFDGDSDAVQLKYDSAGRISQLTVGADVSTFSYESTAGRLSQAASDEVTLSYIYSGALLDRVTASGLLTGTVDASFDDNVRLSTLAVTGGTTINYSYDADGLLVGLEDLSIERDPASGGANGTALGVVTDARTVNSRGELIDYVARVSGEDVFSYEDTLDGLGRVTARTETLLDETHNYSYIYDSAGQLLSVERDGAPLESYVYDARGNRLSLSGASNDVAASYDHQDRLQDFGGASYTYSPSGLLAQRTLSTEHTSYTYDSLGRLQAVTLPNGQQIEYVLDALGRRTGRKVDGALTHRFLYGAGPRPIADRGASGSSTVAQFVFGEFQITPEFIIKGNATYRIVSDRIGSVRLVINTADGTVAQRLDYDVWGRVLLDTNPGFQPFGFAGGLYDADTGLVRFGARDYDSVSGRWTAKDPILFAGGQTNLYVYSFNDPVNWLDVTGNEPISVGTAIVVGTTVGAAAGFVTALWTGGDITSGILTGAATGFTASTFGAASALLSVAGLGTRLTVLGVNAMTTGLLTAGLGQAAGNNQELGQSITKGLLSTSAGGLSPFGTGSILNEIFGNAIGTTTDAFVDDICKAGP